MVTKKERKSHALFGDYYNKAGIYSIVNVNNGHTYIGQAKDIGKRWKGHKDALQQNKHSNSYLQHAYNKYGKSVFTFAVIEYIDEPTKYNLDQREQYWIDKLRPEYNLNQYSASEIESHMLRFKYVDDLENEVLILKSWQRYKPPKWTEWVYGGARNPLL